MTQTSLPSEKKHKKPVPKRAGMMRRTIHLPAALVAQADKEALRLNESFGFVIRSWLREKGRK